MTHPTHLGLPVIGGTGPPEPKPKRGGKADLNALLLALIRSKGLGGDIPEPHLEYRFHPIRRWRFDFAWPEHRLAVEVDGLVWSGRGGHQTVDGILADCEKYEAALLAGWIVYRVPGPWLTARPAETLNAIRVLLT